MFEKKRHVRIAAESWVEDPEDAHVDVVVTFPDATTWIADFYTFKCLESIREDYRVKGYGLDGAYWAASKVVLVDRVTRERIEQIVDELIEKGTFSYAFEYLGAVDERALQTNGYPADFFDENAKMDPSYVKWFAANLVQMLEQTDKETRTAVLKEMLDIFEEKERNQSGDL